MNRKIYSECISYIIFGTLTTVVNFAVYFMLAQLIGLPTVTSNLTATVVSILFAYITNKIYVFKSKSNTFKELIAEMLKFFEGRVATGILDTIIVIIGVDYIKANERLIKTDSCLAVIILNYVISKVLIFNRQ